MVIHIIHHVLCDLCEQISDLVGHLRRHDILKHLQVLAKILTLVFHFGLRSFRFLQFDVERFEFSFSAAELRHGLLIVHLLDLVVLELLLVQLLGLGVGAGVLIDLVKLGRASLLHDQPIGTGVVL